MLSSQLLSTVVLLPLFPIFTQAYNLAPLAAQSLQHRAAYQGGWALGLPGADCPAIAPVACSTMSGNVNPTCCPEGQLCNGSIYPYCCPTGEFCRIFFFLYLDFGPGEVGWNTSESWLSQYGGKYLGRGAGPDGLYPI